MMVPWATIATTGLTKMTNLRWLESFEMGVDDIDDDHRNLVGFIERIQDAFAAGDLAACRENVAKFVPALESHFAREEALLADIDFPRLREHREHHTSLLEKGRAVAEFCETIDDIADIDRCLDELAGFLLDDIIAADVEFKTYIQEADLSRRK